MLISCDSLSTEIIKDFVHVDPETQPRNVAAWTPVVTDILNGCVGFEDAAVSVMSVFDFGVALARPMRSKADGNCIV